MHDFIDGIADSNLGNRKTNGDRKSFYDAVHNKPKKALLSN